MSSLKLSRRTLLRGAGVSMALPWLEAMSGGVRRAHAAPAKRLVVFFSPNGSIRDAWTPTGTETEFQLSRILAPLEPHKKDIVVLDGVDNVAATKGPGDDHMRGMGCMLTGIELLPGKTMGGGGTPAGYAGGISVDQEIVRVTRPTTKFPSLELGVKAGATGTVWGYSNYKAAGQPLPLDSSPKSVFERIFSELAIAGQDNSSVTRLRNDRKSVLDAVLRNYKLLSGKLGGADKAKLDQHLTAVSELEKRVVNAPTTEVSAKGCMRPTAATLDAKGDFQMVGKTQMDLLVMAMACDLTRVGTIQWSNSVGGTLFTWLGATRGHHDMSHDPDSNLESKEMLTKINVWYAEQLAYLIDRMKQVPEEGGTLFDNSLIIWVNELARGNAHSHSEMPYVLAGRAGGALRTGRYLKFTGTVPHNNLLVSVLNAFGVNAKSFGNPAYCTGPLAGLL